MSSQSERRRCSLCLAATPERHRGDAALPLALPDATNARVCSPHSCDLTTSETVHIVGISAKELAKFVDGDQLSELCEGAIPGTVTTHFRELSNLNTPSANEMLTRFFLLSSLMVFGCRMGSEWQLPHKHALLKDRPVCCVTLVTEGITTVHFCFVSCFLLARVCERCKPCFDVAPFFVLLLRLLRLTDPTPTPPMM